jgi:hypothetical protein
MTRWCVIALVAILAGCGPKAPPKGSAHGKLLIGGKAPPYPVAVIFVNASQGLALAGATKEDGTYQLDGDVKTGEYTVYLEKVVNSDGPVSTAKNVLTIVPKEYRTEDASPLKKTINEGDNEIDLEVPAIEGASKS